jgi:S1-C subfamily serine protease
MATGLVIHIASGKDKHTEVLTDEHIRIGSRDDCDLRLRLSALPRNAADDGIVLELARSNGSYRVIDFDQSLSLTRNGGPLETNAEIQDGDEVGLPGSDLTLQFFPIRSLPAVINQPAHESHVAPFIEQAAIESAATARRDDAKVFLREFTRELVKEINPSTKLITLAMAVALVGGMLYLGFAIYKEIRGSRRLIDDQRAQLALMKDQVTKTNSTLTDIDRSNREIRDSLSLAVKLRGDYGSGVSLISGSYYYVEAGTGRPLRHTEAQISEGGATAQSGGEAAELTFEGKGTIAEYEFVGTGFYVGGGFVVTNRHIVQPWLADDQAQSLGNSVRGQPRLRKLNAYFPEHTQAIPLKFKQASGRDDLAVCLLDIKEFPENIPMLPLEVDKTAVEVGKNVVMMGYPSGPDRLLALLDDAESRDIQARYGGSLDAMLGYLAGSRRLQPQTTQGSITDVEVRRIAYDARTAEGGSGAPVFGPTGRVIGVNFAVFTGGQASNLAVPIQYGIALLERAGWTSPPPKDSKDSENAIPPAK